MKFFLFLASVVGVATACTCNQGPAPCDTMIGSECRCHNNALLSCYQKFKNDGVNCAYPKLWDCDSPRVTCSTPLPSGFTYTPPTATSSYVRPTETFVIPTPRIVCGGPSVGPPAKCPEGAYKYKCSRNPRDSCDPCKGQTDCYGFCVLKTDEERKKDGSV